MSLFVVSTNAISVLETASSARRWVVVVGDWLPGDGGNIIARRVISVRMQYDDCTVPYTEPMLQARHERGEDTPVWWQPNRSQAQAVEPPLLSAATTQPSLSRDVPLDPELGRLAIGLHQFPLFRVWCYGRQLQHGPGWIEKDVFFEYLRQLGIVTSRRGFNDLLQKGGGIYWAIAPATCADGQIAQRLYLRSPIKVAGRLTKRAQRHNFTLVATNRPGVRRVLVNLTGSLKDAEARVYNAWLAQKGKSNQISRAHLEALWNRRTSTLLEWEERTGITVEPVYAEFDDIRHPLMPNYAYLCQARDGSFYASARLPNKYHAVEVKEHPRGGNRRKARRAANAKLAGVQPAVHMGGGSGRHSLRTGRLYFGDRQTRRGTELASKQLNRHLRKHGDLNVRHYLFGVQRHDVTVMLHSQGDPKVVQQRDWKAERTPEFLKQRIGYREWLESAQKNAP